MRFCQFIEPIAPLGKESIAKRFETGFRARGRRVRMTGAGNQEHAETVGGGYQSPRLTAGFWACASSSNIGTMNADEGLRVHFIPYLREIKVG